MWGYLPPPPPLSGAWLPCRWSSITWGWCGASRQEMVPDKNPGGVRGLRSPPSSRCMEPCSTCFCADRGSSCLCRHLWAPEQNLPVQTLNSTRSYFNHPEWEETPTSCLQIKSCFKAQVLCLMDLSLTSSRQVLVPHRVYYLQLLSAELRRTSSGSEPDLQERPRQEVKACHATHASCAAASHTEKMYRFNVGNFHKNQENLQF